MSDPAMSSLVPGRPKQPGSAAALVDHARLDVAAAADPAILSRILALFAKLNHIPDEVHAVRDGEWQRIGLSLPRNVMGEERIAYVARQIASLVAVDQVLLDGAAQS